MSSVPPTSSFCLQGTWKCLFCRPLGLSASLCRAPALLGFLGSGFLTKVRRGDHVSARRKEASVFSHSAHSLSGSPGKKSSHPRARGCATTRVAVFRGKSAICPCLISWAVQDPRAASFLQLYLAVRENEESKQSCQRSRMPNSIIVSWRWTQVTFPQHMWCLWKYLAYLCCTVISFPLLSTFGALPLFSWWDMRSGNNFFYQSTLFIPIFFSCASVWS